MLLLVGLPIRKESLLWGPISKSIAPNRCIHTADLLLIEFLVHTKTSGMSSGRFKRQSMAFHSLGLMLFCKKSGKRELPRGGALSREQTRIGASC